MATVLPFHRKIVSDPAFAPADPDEAFSVHTRWIETEFDNDIAPFAGAAGEAEGVEQRQRGHKAIVSGKVGNRFDLLYVRQNAFVTVNHTFRVAFRAGGKEDNGIILRLLLNLRQTRQ